MNEELGIVGGRCSPSAVSAAGEALGKSSTLETHESNIGRAAAVAALSCGWLSESAASRGRCGRQIEFL